MDEYSKVLVLICFFSFFLTGCDNSVDPLNKEQGAYSIYGYLNIYKDVNYIRVKNLNSSFLQDSTGDIDADVTLKNLNSGATEKLEDSIVVFDEVKTHNFRTTMDILPATKFRVDVEAQDGRKVSATATSPPIAETDVGPIGANCSTNVDLNFDPVSSKFALDLEVGLHYDSKEFWIRANKFLSESDGSVTASFTPYDILDGVFGLTAPDSEDPLKVYCHQLDAEKLMARYAHYGPDLFANTISDTLQIPGGAGRLGALYRDSFSFRIDTSKLCPPFPLEECTGIGAKDNVK